MGVEYFTLPFAPLPSREGKNSEEDYTRTWQSAIGIVSAVANDFRPAMADKSHGYRFAMTKLEPRAPPLPFSPFYAIYHAVFTFFTL